MRISNHTDRLEACFGALGAVRMNCEAGFEAIDYTMYNAERAVFGKGGTALVKEMCNIASAHGVVFNQTHVPFSTFKIGAENDAKNRAIYDSIIRALDITARLGAPVAVVHPALICPCLTPDERFDMNMEFLGKVATRAKSLGIKIAVENMYGRHKDKNSKLVKNVCSDAEELIRYVDALDRDVVSACLDVGHAGLVGEAADAMALALGDRLTTIHIHDNDFLEDKHTLPYFGDMNYKALTGALAKIKYSGDLTLEADWFYRPLPDALVPAALAFSCAVAKHLRDEILAKI